MTGQSNTRLGGLPSVVAALLVVLSSVGGVTMLGSQPASADIGVQGDCTDDVLGLISGTGSIPTIYSNARDPCFAQNNDIGDVDTPEQAKRQIAQAALEDRRYLETYWTQFDDNSDRLENPAYLDAKTAFATSMSNGSTETAAITDARAAVHNRTASQQESLWLQYSSVLDTMERLEYQAQDNDVRDESIRIGTFENGSFQTGYTLQNYSEMGATVNVTLTDGSQVEVPAPYQADNGTVTETLHPTSDNVIIQVYSPESGEWVDVINTVQTFSDTSSPAVDVDSPGQNSAPFSVSGAHTASFVITADNTGSSDQEIWGDAGGGSGNYMHIAVTPDHSLRVASDSLAAETNASVVPRGEQVRVTYQYTGDRWKFWVGDELVMDKSQSSSLDYSDEPPIQDGDNDVQSVHEVQAWHSAISQSKLDKLTNGETDYTSHVGEFDSRHSELESVDNRVLDALGTAEAGYLNDVATNVDLGNLNYSDMYTPYDKFRLNVEPSDVGEKSWLSYQRASLGYSSAETNSTVELKILSGATVDGTTLTSNMTVEGQLFTAGSPPAGNWSSGETYTVADVGGPVYMHRTVTEQTTQNGTITYETGGQTTTISSGEFVIVGLTGADGTQVQSVDHTDRDPQTTDVSQFTSEIESLQDTIEDLEQQIDEDDDGNATDGGVAGGGGGDGDGLIVDLGALGEIELPFSTAQITTAGIVVGGGLLILILLQSGILPILAGLVGFSRR